MCVTFSPCNIAGEQHAVDGVIAFIHSEKGLSRTSRKDALTPPCDDDDDAVNYSIYTLFSVTLKRLWKQ